MSAGEEERGREEETERDKNERERESETFLGFLHGRCVHESRKVERPSFSGHMECSWKLV